MESYIAWIENVLILMPNMAGTIADHEDVRLLPRPRLVQRVDELTQQRVRLVAHRKVHAPEVLDLGLWDGVGIECSLDRCRGDVVRVELILGHQRWSVHLEVLHRLHVRRVRGVCKPEATASMRQCHSSRFAERDHG